MSMYFAMNGCLVIRAKLIEISVLASRRPWFKALAASHLHHRITYYGISLTHLIYLLLQSRKYAAEGDYLLPIETRILISLDRDLEISYLSIPAKNLQDRRRWRTSINSKFRNKTFGNFKWT